MADQPEKRFSFVSNAVSADTFAVVRFRGEEGLSRCYRFEIELASEESALDLKAILRNPATFIIRRPEGDIPFHGIPAEFRQLHQAGAYTFYKAVLVPRLWWLSLTHHNQVFLDQSLPEILGACLEDAGLSSADFELRTQRDHPHWEYVCQYRESHLNFLSHGFEWAGIYYYFEQDGSAEKVVFTDTKVAHESMPQGDSLRYRALAAMETFHREEVIWGFECRQHLLPQSLLIKDFNPETPSLDLSASAPVSPDGRGKWYLYGEHFMTPEEGGFLAQIRAEALMCREQEFTGESAIPFLRPGYTFRLEDHYRDDFNKSYLTTLLAHEGSQAAYLLAGLGIPLAPGEEEPFYRNRFTAIPASVQFRSERVTERSRFYGLLNAKIDAAASGQYAELDDLGRYKVILPFDLSGRKDGKASAWLRMMTPYAGSDHGMHFPLHKGTEVLLAFIDGDPNRPVIAGAVPNPATPSPVTGDNQTMAVLQTGGSNRMAIEDKAGSERFLFHVPNQGVYLRIGAPNDPTPTPTPTRPGPPTPTPSPEESPTPDLQEQMESLEQEVTDLESEVAGLKAEMEGDLQFKCHNEKTTISGNKFEMVVGATEEIFVGNYSHIKLITAVDVVMGVAFELKLALKGKYLQNEIHFSPVKWGVHFERVDTEGEVSHLATEVNNLRGVENKLVTSVSQLAGQTSRLAGDVSELSGEVNHMAGTVDQLAVATNALAAEVSQLEGTDTQVIGETLQTVGADTRVIAERTHTIAASTNTIAEKTDVSANNTVLSALTTII